MKEFDPESCWAYVPEDEYSCHFSMFVRRKCKPQNCNRLDSYNPEEDDGEVMTERILHAASLGEEGEWEER